MGASHWRTRAWSTVRKGGCIAVSLLALASAWAGAAEPTEAEIRAEYDRAVKDLGPYQYHVRHLMLPTREQAQAALDEIRGGADFAAVARRVSTDPGSRDRGGDLGWVHPRHFDEAFAAAMQALPAGGLSASPAHSRFGWHVIRVEEIRPVRVFSFEQARSQIEAKLKNDRETAQANSPKDLPAWTPQEWDLLFASAQHTAGGRSFEYRVQMFLDEQAAQRASDIGLVSTRRDPLPTSKARNLLDVEPELRFALSRLYVDGDTSAPLPRVDASGAKSWRVVQLVTSGRAEALRADPKFQQDAARWVAKGFLPEPKALETPAERARVAYFRAGSEAAVQAIAAELNADTEFGNGSTPLTQAMLRRDLPLAQALVQRGADVNHCAVWGCPLELAAKFEDEAEALAWVSWLLHSGARVDGPDPRGPTQFGTALTSASWMGHLKVAQRLVDSGAAIDGASDASLRPVEAAALQARRAMVDWLIAHKASLLPRPSHGLRGPTTLYTAARQSKDDEFARWAEQAMVDAAARDPRYRIKLAFEQDGKLHEPRNDKVRLRARPFKLVFQLAPGADGVQLGGSFDAAWLEEVRRRDVRNSMLRPFASGALAPADQAGSQDLLIMQACREGVRPDQGCDGAFMMLETDPAVRDDFHERGPKPGRYARDVRTLIDTSDDSRPPKSLPVQQLAGKTLYLALGHPLNIGGPQGLRLPLAQYLTLQFSD